MNYTENNYKYICSICNTSEMNKIEEQCEECDYGEIYDDNGNMHSHDLNDGTTFLICENNHKTTTQYIPSCTCGWNIIDG